MMWMEPEISRATVPVAGCDGGGNSEWCRKYTVFEAIPTVLVGAAHGCRSFWTPSKSFRQAIGAAIGGRSQWSASTLVEELDICGSDQTEMAQGLLNRPHRVSGVEPDATAKQKRPPR